MDNLHKNETLADLSRHVCNELGDAAIDADICFGELNLQVRRQDIVNVARYLRDDPNTGFISFIDLCGVDYPERDKRFDVVYHLMNPRSNLRLRVRIKTDEETLIPSIVSIYPGAEWFEREAYDMYGILFSGHPDLRRLLTDYGFDGYPLRKDFPLTGYVETRYDEELKRVVYEPVELRQEFRNFDFLSPWEGQGEGERREFDFSEKKSDLDSDADQRKTDHD